MDSLETSSDCQQPQSEENKDEISKHLDEDTDLTDPGSDAPSLQKELHHKTNQTSAEYTMAEESMDLHLPSQEEDQQTVRPFDREADEDTERHRCSRHIWRNISPWHVGFTPKTKKLTKC